MRKVVLILVILIALVGVTAVKAQSVMSQLVIEPPTFYSCSWCESDDAQWLSFRIYAGDIVGDLSILFVNGEYQTSFYEWGHKCTQDFFNVQHSDWTVNEYTIDTCLFSPVPSVSPNEPVKTEKPEPTPMPTVEPTEKPKCNSDRGNGSEGSPDCDPGKSYKNQGGD